MRPEGARVRRRPHGARPGSNVACGLQPAQVWNPATNPTGERCGIADFMRAIFGVTVTPDAPNGKGKLAVDNVGVQYGLRALQSGQITPEQFVDLNRKVGGMDIDGNFVSQRTSPTRTRCGSPTRPGASTAAPVRRSSRRSTTAPEPRWTTRASTRRSTRSATARGSTLQRQPRQPGHLAVSHRRRRAEPVRRHAPVAATAASKPRRGQATPASWPMACRAI